MLMMMMMMMMKMMMMFFNTRTMQLTVNYRTPIFLAHSNK